MAAPSLRGRRHCGGGAAAPNHGPACTAAAGATRPPRTCASHLRPPLRMVAVAAAQEEVASTSGRTPEARSPPQPGARSAAAARRRIVRAEPAPEPQPSGGGLQLGAVFGVGAAAGAAVLLVMYRQLFAAQANTALGPISEVRSVGRVIFVVLLCFVFCVMTRISASGPAWLLQLRTPACASSSWELLLAELLAERLPAYVLLPHVVTGCRHPASSNKQAAGRDRSAGRGGYDALPMGWGAHQPRGEQRGRGQRHRQASSVGLAGAVAP
jgi:hypothetical protein